MRYRLEITRKAQKRIQRLPTDVRRAITETIDRLATNPRPYGCKKLRGQENYTIRSGNYRVIYNIQDDVLVVLVIEAGHRRDIYRNL